MRHRLMPAGEVVWVGVEPLGDRDGRIALYLADHVARLRQPAGTTKTAAPRTREAPADPADRERAIVECLRTRGASFFGPLHEAVGGGYPGETVDALWNLGWQGVLPTRNSPDRPGRTGPTAPR